MHRLLCSNFMFLSFEKPCLSPCLSAQSYFFFCCLFSISLFIIIQISSSFVSSSFRNFERSRRFRFFLNYTEEEEKKAQHKHTMYCCWFLFTIYVVCRTRLSFDLDIQEREANKKQQQTIRFCVCVFFFKKISDGNFFPLKWRSRVCCVVVFFLIVCHAHINTYVRTLQSKE